MAMNLIQHINGYKNGLLACLITRECFAWTLSSQNGSFQLVA